MALYWQWFQVPYPVVSWAYSLVYFPIQHPPLPSSIWHWGWLFQKSSMQLVNEKLCVVDSSLTFKNSPSSTIGHILGRQNSQHKATAERRPTVQLSRNLRNLRHHSLGSLLLDLVHGQRRARYNRMAQEVRRIRPRVRLESCVAVG